MFDYFVLGYHMAKEAITAGELKALIKRQVSWRRLMTPVEMDLSVLVPDSRIMPNDGLRFLELHKTDLQAGKWVFSVRSRGVKALYKIKKGSRGFALVQNNTVIADVWCIFPKDGRSLSHPDLKMLGLTCQTGEAYAFDMLIAPAYRGKNLAVPLQRALQWKLKNEGFMKVYGFFYNDNLPALWMHRMLKYKELPKRQVSRFFMFSSAGKAKLFSPPTKKNAINQAA